MALSEKHRSELYQYFEPELGDEVTEALLREFPKGTGDEPVTREYLDLRLEALIGRLTGVILGVASLIVVALGVATTVIIATVG